jgi:hypothetical protein
LETYSHEQSAWVTLTYADDTLPEGWNLEPKLFRAFLNRLRNYYPPKSIRYFGVGEYGDKSTRPHYHAILYGVSPLDSHIVEKCWHRDGVPLGFIQCAEVSPALCSYTCGYVDKKIVKRDDPRTRNRVPEFQRQSNRPGIGRDAIDLLYRNCAYWIRDELANTGDVPGAIRLNGQLQPIGRYLKNRLRKLAGMTDEQRQACVDNFFAEKGEEMLALWNNSEEEALTFKEVWKKKNKQYNASLRARNNIHDRSSL